MLKATDFSWLCVSWVSFASGVVVAIIVATISGVVVVVVVTLDFLVIVS
jgi:hypothetical protein